MPATKDSFWNAEGLGLLSSSVRNIDSFYLYMKIICTARIKAQKIGILQNYPGSLENGS